MRLGVVLPMFSGDPEKVLAAAREAEDLGFDGVFAFDHFFPPGAAPHRPSLEAFTTLASVAAVTERVSLGTLVIRAVLRPPGLVAKMAAMVDAVSEGRMILGIGTGDPIDRPAHDTYGFPNLTVEERRAHLEETVVALGALFRGERYRGGERIPPIDGPLVPRSVSPGGPPLWLGAQADEVVRLAARSADAWNGWGFRPERYRRKADLLREEAEQAGRSVEATWAGIVLIGEDEAEADRLLEERLRKRMADQVAFAGSAEGFARHLEELAAASASWAVVVLAGPPGRRQLVAERVLPTLRART